MDRITVLCPKHRSSLELAKETISFFGKEYPVTIGCCNSCREKYLSTKIFAANDSISIKGQRYLYLKDMETAHEYLVQMEKRAAQKTVEEERRRQQEIAERLKAEKEAEARRVQEEARQKLKAALEKREAEQRAKRARREAVIVEREKKIQSGELKVFYASKLIYLPIAPTHCYNDGRKLYLFDNRVIDFCDYKIRKRAWCCAKCNTAHFLNTDREAVEGYMKAVPTEEIETPKKPSNTTLMAAHGEPVNHAIPQNTLYICKGLISCKKHGHSVVSATGVMIGKNGKVIKINTNYCPQCKKYFISYDEYLHYKQIYGILMGNIRITNGSFAPFNGDLAQESPLYICGYSVNQTDNLSATMRQQILQYLIDSRIMSKPEIISYLNGFIRRNGKRANMEEAVCRWRADIAWVRNYRIDRQRYFEIANIQKK